LELAPCRLHPDPNVSVDSRGAGHVGGRLWHRSRWAAALDRSGGEREGGDDRQPWRVVGGSRYERSGDRLWLAVRHWGWGGRTHNGQLIVNARAAQPLRRVFRKLYGLHFRVRHMQLDDFYGPKRDRPRT
jgi:hypothetical protein